MSRERTRRAEEETKAPVAKKNFVPDINLSLRCEVSDEFQISILNYIIANCEYHGNTCFHIKIFVILVRL